MEMAMKSNIFKSVSRADDFFQGPLVTWLRSCTDSPTKAFDYDDLIDGVIIHQVFLKINSDPHNNNVVPSNGDSKIRLKNLETILNNIKHFYEEELSNLVLQIPDIGSLVDEPYENVQEMNLLLYLLLACAVQSSNKELFIKNSALQKLSSETQSNIVDCIKQVTEGEYIVLNNENLTKFNSNETVEHLKHLIQEHSSFREKLRRLSKSPELLNDSFILSEKPDIIRKAADLADLKAKLKTQQEYILEMEEELFKSSTELADAKNQLDKYKLQNQDLLLEARKAKAYRDDLDVAIEQAEKVETLEKELIRYKEKIMTFEGLKDSVNELQKQNELLSETKDIIQDESQKKILHLHIQNKDYKQQIVELSAMVDDLERKNLNLQEEKNNLEKIIKNPSKKLLDTSYIIMDSDDFLQDSFQNCSISDQMSQSIQTRELKLELENRRLSSLVDSMKETTVYNKSLEQTNLNCIKSEFKFQIEQLKKELIESTEENNKLVNSLKIQQEMYETKLRNQTNHHINIEKEFAPEIKRSSNNSPKEYEKLKLDFENLYNICTKLKDESDLKTLEIDRLKKKEVKMQRIIELKNKKIDHLDIEIDRVTYQYNSMIQLNKSIENDKQLLMEHVSRVSIQYHNVIQQTLIDKEHYHFEERKHIGKINDLQRHKEKLEEKIMDHYKKMENSTKKKSLGALLTSKMKRAGSELLNKSRRFSFIEDRSKQEEKCPDIEDTLKQEHILEDSNILKRLKRRKSRNSVDIFDHITPIEYDQTMQSEIDVNHTINDVINNPIKNSLHFSDRDSKTKNESS